MPLEYREGNTLLDNTKTKAFKTCEVRLRTLEIVFEELGICKCDVLISVFLFFENFSNQSAIQQTLKFISIREGGLTLYKFVVWK